MPVLIISKFDEQLIKNEDAIDQAAFSPLKVYMSFWLTWKPAFSADLPQNLMQSFPHQNDASYKIWSKLANWPQRYVFKF